MKRWIEKAKGYIRIRRWRAAIGVTWLLPVKKKKIVFNNFNGLGYGESPKYIAQEFLQRKGWDCVWLVKDPKKVTLPSGVRAIKMNTWRAFYEIGTAGVWISDTRLPMYFIKRRKQFYIQTWHGGVGFKKAEKGAEDKLSSNYIRVAKRDSKMADLFISNSKERTRLYRENFWYDGKILECGFPKNDLLISKQSNQAVIREELGIKNKNARLAFYAPTFRDTSRGDWYDIDYNRVLAALEKKFGGEWEFLVRFHPNTPASLIGNLPGGKIHNASAYGDISEILCVTDVLISDYSSIILDISMINKPVFLYIPDRAVYEKDRGFKYKFEELPYPNAVNNEEMEGIIYNYNDAVYQVKLEGFMKQFGFLESGHASKIIYDMISERQK